VLIIILIVPEPSSATIVPCVIDLTRSSPPLVGPTSPVATSPASTIEKYLAAIRGKYLISYMVFLTAFG
jgi:hypothetical protein